MVIFKSLIKIEALITNTSWLVGSEILAKASRLLVIFTLAAILDPTEYGAVMLALASHEIFKLVQRCGAGAQIIQCPNHKLERFIQTGIVIQWGLGLGLLIFQTGFSFLLAQFYDRPELFPLLSAMALVYLFYPLVSMNVFLLQRNNELKQFSIKNASCIVVENAAIAISAMFGAGIYSIVIGKWSFLLCWLLMFWRSEEEIPSPRIHWNTFKYLISSSLIIFFTELSRALKNQTDIFVGAKVLSPEVFGVYSFAKTAGVNLGQSLSSAFNAAVYPFLCERRRSQNQVRMSPVYWLCACLSGLFVLQALFVPLYVPVLFTHEWQQEYLVIGLLCLANIPITWIDTLCNQYRAKGLYKFESLIRIFSFLFVVVFYWCWSSKNLEDHAQGLLVVNIALMVTFTIPFFFKTLHVQNGLSKEHKL